MISAVNFFMKINYVYFVYHINENNFTFLMKKLFYNYNIDKLFCYNSHSQLTKVIVKIINENKMTIVILNL